MRFVGEVGTGPLGGDFTARCVWFIRGHDDRFFVVQLDRVRSAELRLDNQQRRFHAYKSQVRGYYKFGSLRYAPVKESLMVEPTLFEIFVPLLHELTGATCVPGSAPPKDVVDWSLVVDHASAGSYAW